MGVEAGSVQRAVRGLTLGMVKAHEAAKVRAWEGGIDEYDQQFQLPFSGHADKRPVYVTLPVSFDVSMLYAPDQNASPYPNPLFTYGFEITAGQPFLTAYVTGWGGGATGVGVGGATVTIAAFIPDARRLQPFAGIAHLNFEGYGAPLNDDDQDEDEATDTSGSDINAAGEDVTIDTGDAPEDPS